MYIQRPKEVLEESKNVHTDSLTQYGISFFCFPLEQFKMEPQLETVVSSYNLSV